MKISKSQLKKIIKEELANVLKEKVKDPDLAPDVAGIGLTATGLALLPIVGGLLIHQDPKTDMSLVDTIATAANSVATDASNYEEIMGAFEEDIEYLTKATGRTNTAMEKCDSLPPGTWDNRQEHRKAIWACKAIAKGTPTDAEKRGETPWTGGTMPPPETYYESKKNTKTKVSNSRLLEIIQEEISKVLRENIDIDIPPDVADVMDIIEYAVDDLVDRGLEDAEQIKKNLLELAKENDHFKPIADPDLPPGTLTKAIKRVLALGPDKFEYDPHADI
jgi:hypothetical protein